MFYVKPLLKKKVTTLKLNFIAFAKIMTTDVDEGLMPIKYSKLSYNFNIKNGALCDGYGFKDLCLPKRLSDLSNQCQIVCPNLKIKKIWHFKYYDHNQDKPNHQLLAYCEDGNVYYTAVVGLNPNFNPLWLNPIFTSGLPNAINYNLNGTDYMIFSSSTEGMWAFTPSLAVQKIENAPHIISMCVHYERLFAIVGGEQNKLVFSDDLDPTNWTEELDSGGFIQMQDERGKLVKVVSFNDYVYVFREFGVAKVSAYGDQQEFSVSQLFVSGSKLYGDTVCVCGDKIMLLSRDGIHMFDGYATKKLKLGIDELFKNVNNDGANALYFENKYYLSCRLNFNDNQKIGCENYANGYVNNVLIEYNLSTGEVNITRGVDISCMLRLDDGNVCKFVACFNGEYSSRIGELTQTSQYFETQLKKCWISPKTNLGYPGKLKNIKECYIKSKSDCSFKITTEKTSKIFNVKASDVSKRIKINMMGEEMQVEFISEMQNSQISAPQIIIGVNS